MGNGDATIIQRHMEFNAGIAYGINRLLEPPDLGSRCDEFISVELQVSTCDEASEDLCLGRGMLGRRGCCSSLAELQAAKRCRSTYQVVVRFLSSLHRDLWRAVDSVASSHPALLAPFNG